MQISKEMPKNVLKPQVLERVRKNKQLKRALTDLFDIDPSTLYRWIKSNDPNLIRWDALKMICEYLEVKDPSDCIQDSNQNLS